MRNKKTACLILSLMMGTVMPGMNTVPFAMETGPSAVKAESGAFAETDLTETESEETESAETDSSETDPAEIDPAETGPADSHGDVADASEMLSPESVTEEGMVPVKADELQDGTYEIEVNSSSSMFEITSCTLSVEDGSMTAAMHMGGTGYLYVYPGTPEEAAQAKEEAFIPFEEMEDGTHVFTLPVEALDEAVECAAFSKRKEKWYGRQLCFLADSLPDEAFKEARSTSIAGMDLEDGIYTAEAALEGGSGRASITSPAKLEVAGDTVTATIEWSSPNYDYMIVEEEKYLPVNTDGNSVFEIPVTAFDRPIRVLADTTAMSKPYEIEYKITFDSSTIEKE